jgi:hypothetical protein
MSSFYNSTHKYCDATWGVTTKFGNPWQGEPFAEEAKRIPERWSESRERESGKSRGAGENGDELGVCARLTGQATRAAC